MGCIWYGAAILLSLASASAAAQDATRPRGAEHPRDRDVPVPPMSGDRKFLIVPAILLILAGCGDPLPRLNAVPAAEEEKATIPDMADIRYWGDNADPAAFIQATEDAYDRELALYGGTEHQDALPPAHFLAISGGGENGAFGAGLLVGWTAAGTRPTFKGVTGISTGALTAPFAFLGPAYDDELKEVYTTISAKDVLQPRGYLAVVFQDAIADNTPLRRTIARYVDQAMLDEIAAEHAKGRILLIGTTNLDARRPVIWDIGKIAASGHPGALDLVRDILVASAAIPGAFPPVMIDVELDGRTYEEMHVDGGASAQVFVYPPSIDIHARDAERGIERERHLYVIRNARLDPDWAQVERRTFSILERTVSSLIQTQGWATSTESTWPRSATISTSTSLICQKVSRPRPRSRSTPNICVSFSRSGTTWPSMATPGPRPRPATRRRRSSRPCPRPRMTHGPSRPVIQARQPNGDYDESPQDPPDIVHDRGGGRRRPWPDGIQRRRGRY
ncbi:patatin-like phospholipase family protein [Inquilinus sp. CAU 1745]|uniref:patatin-like phospholipase family protein n=1 Tax=Inquilinus sp. CAU 1745 TaxID=3140369 RepID=UPI00325B4FFC